MLGGEIKVTMTLDNGQFVIQSAKSGRVIQELRQNVEATGKSVERLERHFTGLKGQFRDLVQTASMLRYALHDVHDIFMALPGAVLKSSGEIERLTKLMEGMSKQTTDAARKAEALSNVDFVFDLAQNAPFEVKALTDAFVKLKSGGLDPTNGSLQALVDSVARFGGDSEKLNRAAIAIQQMAGKGVISMEELRQQLGEAVPNAINMMAQGAGMGMAEFSKLVSTGTVEATQSLNNMFTVMRFENDGAAQSMMTTWTGMLALLKTKFELFKKDVGDADFFKESKEALEDVIGLFGTKEARTFAYDLGQGLASLVRLLETIIKTTAEWWDTIKLIGQAFATLFVANKVVAMTTSIMDLVKAKRALYEDAVGSKQAKLNDDAARIAQEIAAEERAFASKQAMFARERQAEEKREAEENSAAIKRMQRQRQQAAQEISERVAHYQSMLRLQQQFAGQQMAAELAAEATMRQKKAGSAAAARVQMAEANRLGGNATVAGNAASAIQAEIVALRAKEAALLNNINATRSSTVATGQNAAVAAAAASHARTMADLMERQGIAANAAAGGLGLLGRATTGLKLIFDAFGGWIGVALAALTFLGQKIYDYINRWERFRDIVKQTERGVASEDGQKIAEIRAKEAQSELNAINARLREAEAAEKAGNTTFLQARAQGAGKFKKDDRGNLVPDPEGYKQMLRDQAAKLAADFQLASKTLEEQKKLILDDAVDASTQDFRRRTERELRESDRAYKMRVDALEQERRAEIDAAQAGGKKLTEGQKKAIEDRYAQLKNVEILKSRETRLSALSEREKGIRDELAKLKQGTTEYAKAQANLFAVQQLFEQTEKEIESAANLGKIGKTVADPKPNLKEDPIVREAERAKAAAAEALIAYKQALIGNKEIGDIKKQIAVGVLGDIAQGKFDTKEIGPDGKEKIPVRFGDLDKRKKFVESFMAEVVNGKKSVDDFVSSLKLTKAQTDQVLAIINDLSSADRYKDARKAEETSNGLLADSLRDLDAAREETATNGIAKEDKALNALNAKYDELLNKLERTSDEYKRIEGDRNKAVAAAGDARNLRSVFEMREENRKFVEETITGVERSKVARVRATMDYKQTATAVYDEELRAFTSKESKILMESALRYSRGTISEAEYQAEISRIQSAGMEFREEALNRYVENSKSAMEKLADTWKNSVDAMNAASANWAQQTMDYITRAMNGEKVGKFKDVVVGALKDINTILIRKTLGDAVTSVTGGFANMMSDMLGLGGANANGKPDGTAGNPLHVKNASEASDLVKTPFEEAKNKLVENWDMLKDKLSATWDSLKAGLSGIFDRLSGSLSGLLSSISNMLSSGSGGGFGDIIGSLFGGGGGNATSFLNDAGGVELAGSLGFAKGGVMTGLGPMSLNKYANGGIATSPQLALFGEGSMNEAYVPLPDGRSIPVTMTGPNTTTNNQGGVVINIVVNKDGSDSESAAGGEVDAWRTMASRIRGVVMEELVTQQRPGGMLYK